MIHPLLTIILK